MIMVLKIGIAAGVIAFSSWLAGKKPALSGWLIAMPLSTMLALVFAQVEHQDSSKSVEFAKAIFSGVPLSLTFFLPFLFADRLKFSFWMLYGAGVLCLTGSFFIHRWFMGEA